MIYELIGHDDCCDGEFTLGFFDTLAKAEKARKIADEYYEDKGVIYLRISKKNINILKGEFFDDLGPIEIE